MISDSTPHILGRENREEGGKKSGEEEGRRKREERKRREEKGLILQLLSNVRSHL